jgi:hypothetical protein
MWRIEFKNITAKINALQHNERFRRQAGCGLAYTLQEFWKFVSRPSLCETPPERQAATTLAASTTEVRTCKKGK